jgi:type IV secretory pathway TrbD component
VGTANLSNGEPGSTHQTLTASWNGTGWTAAAGPNVLNGGMRVPNILTGVSCAGSFACQAVGTYSVAGVVQSLTASWNGTGWTAAAGPTVQNVGMSQWLQGVSCVSLSCQAVGWYDNGRGSIGSITASSSATWSAAAGPNLLGVLGRMLHNFLTGVSCISPTSCVAVGRYFRGRTDRTLIESYS